MIAVHARRRALFLTSICTGSFLLFLVQPMIARMALPRLGGAPAVWNSAMLVYQALLLAGYAYAHWLGRFAPRRQALIQLALFMIAVLTLPIGLRTVNPDAQINPVLWAPWLLLSSIGPLFFVISAQAPLLQRWFALSGGGDPYPLYAASNIGSFAGLLAYPLAVEPVLALGTQSLGWSLGYALVALLTLLCAMLLPRGGATLTTNALSSPAPDRRTMLRWIALAAIPSGLMLSTTLHLTTDIVAMPLVWVIPLCLYLLSFSVAFAGNRLAANIVSSLAPVVLLAAACASFAGVSDFPVFVASLILSGLFAAAVAIHTQLFDSRPEPEHLTRFYLALSIGGALGGAFCALIAPLIFDWTYEHPILLIAAAFALAQGFVWAKGNASHWIGPIWPPQVPSRAAGIALLALTLLISLIAGGALHDTAKSLKLAVAAALTLFAAFFLHRPALFAGMVASAMLCAGVWDKLDRSLEEGTMTRSYFGVYTVRIDDDSTMLLHGTTIHGVQLHGRGRETRPTSYYAPESGVGIAMRAAPALFGAHARIAVVGLGSGTLACYTQPGQHWTFFEIDPAVESIARDPRRFSFVSRCNPGLNVVIGDARLMLARQPAGDADLLAVDAFSSDAVPMHLLTREAFATYRRYLSPRGLLLVHISNRHLDLEPVISAAARDGWTAQMCDHTPTTADEPTDYASAWIAMSPDPATIAALKSSDQEAIWTIVPDLRGFVPWTDDYGSILPLLKR